MLMRSLLLLAAVGMAAAEITNDKVFLDMVQNNPGDAVAWQQTKYAADRGCMG